MFIGKDFAAKLQEELEVLRGRPLEDLELETDVWEECSDKERLCEHPVVSVHMVTYNHQAFIRQALDSAVSQICDFPFEIVIGEDCSTDDTREICFEYQKRYPDKVRVLYAKENSFKRHHSQIINMWRVTKSCRGEFCAWLEGDDYWTEPYKLQKQVDFMRSHEHVGLLCGGVQIDWCGVRPNETLSAVQTIANGRISGKALWHIHMHRLPLACYTPTWMWRRAPYVEALKRFSLNRWNLLVADGPLMTMMTLLEGDLCALPDQLGAYRINQNSLSHSGTPVYDTGLDTQVVYAYFGAHLLGIPVRNYPLLHRLWRYALLDFAHRKVTGKAYNVKRLWHPVWRRYLFNPINWLYWPFAVRAQMSVRCYGLVREGFWRFFQNKLRRR